MQRFALFVAVGATVFAGCAGLGSDRPSMGASTTPSTTPPAPCCGFAPQTGHAEGADSAAPGLKVVADLRTCDAGFCVTANATNTGSRTYHISSICMPPWTDSMKRDGNDIQHREPQAYCMAFGTKAFRPGEWNAAEFAWDRKVWDSGHAEPAPEGGYDWSFHFEAMDDADGGGRHVVTATLHVIVGET